jgi:hypothetical protein
MTDLIITIKGLKKSTKKEVLKGTDFDAACKEI